MNIKYENDYYTSNIRLRGEGVSLRGTIQRSVETPDGGTWENEGGAPAPDVEVIQGVGHYTAWMKSGTARKQRAARLARPINTITVVPFQKAPADKLVTMFRLEQAKKEEK